MPMPRKPEPTKTCEHCGVTFTRKTTNGRLEDLGVFKRRKYCSLTCANSRKHPEHWETHHWRARKLRGKVCEACGSVTSLHAHHVDQNPENNAPENIQTLCKHCHGFWHNTAKRRKWAVAGRMPPLR
jgi:hypothetical protein